MLTTIQIAEALNVDICKHLVRSIEITVKNIRPEDWNPKMIYKLHDSSITAKQAE